MPKMRQYREVGAEFATSAPFTTTLRQEVNAPASKLFNCLADGPAWKEWLGIDVEWTSPEPRQAGTTRTVRSTGVELDEVFLIWDEGERFNFYCPQGSLPMKAFAEDYVVTSKGENRSELAWSFGYVWGGPLAPVLGRGFNLVFSANSKKSLKKLAALVETSGDRFSA